MVLRKAFSSSALLVFPLALLLIYWEYVYFSGHAIEQTIPSFRVFVALVVLVVLEQLFRYERAVSQRRLAVRDIVSTGVNVLFTGTVATAFFVPLIIFLPEFVLGRSVFFRLEQSTRTRVASAGARSPAV